MNQLQTELPSKIYYHPEIISSLHRLGCNTCDMAFYLMKDIVKSAMEASNESS